ncbi:hypothetical protein LTR95_003125, partial [Oleoguttula sp. CCFEE 5521]
ISTHLSHLRITCAKGVDDPDATPARLWKTRDRDPDALRTPNEASPPAPESSPLTSLYSVSPELQRSAAPLRTRAEHPNPLVSLQRRDELRNSLPKLLTSPLESRRTNVPTNDAVGEGTVKTERMEA